MPMAISHDSENPARPFIIPRLKNTATSFLRFPSSSQIPRHHNSLQPASNLPQNILVKIFLICARSQTDATNWPWVSVSYVCSSWRNAAIGCQDLWRFIDFSHPKWTSISLRRAKSTPVCIVTNVHQHNVLQIRRVLQLAHQVREIHLVSSNVNIQPLLEILAHPNPALVSLIVDVKVKTSDPWSYEPLTFPTGGPQLSSLRYMKLSNAPFYILTSRCTLLTHLHLQDIPPAERPTGQEFLKKFGGLKHLQSFTLDNAFPIISSVDEEPVQHVKLPSLTELKLCGSIEEITFILQRLIIPPTCKLTCNVTSFYNLTAHLWNMTQALSVHLWTAAELKPAKVIVITGYEESYRYHHDTSHNPDYRQTLRIRAYAANDVEGYPTFDMSLGGSKSQSTDEFIILTLTAIWKALSLSQVHTLALQDVDVITHKSWSQFLRTLPSLRVLDISGQAAPSGLVWALLLNARSHAMGDEEAQQVLVPRLFDVYLHDMNCSTGGYMVSSSFASVPINTYTNLDDSGFLDVLSQSLLERSRFGLRLRSFSIANSESVSPKVVQDTRGAVANLIWDGKGMIKPPVQMRNGMRLAPQPEKVPENEVKYRKVWMLEPSPLRHYHRLRMLLEGI